MQVMSILVQYFEAGQEKVRGPFIFKYMAHKIRELLGTYINKCINQKERSACDRKTTFNFTFCNLICQANMNTESLFLITATFPSTN